jgi:hypothetical protein
MLICQPSDAEVHQRAGEGATDNEIHDWLGQNVHRVRAVAASLRAGSTAEAAGLDWTEVLAVETDNPHVRLAAELLASPAHRGIRQRAEPSRRWAAAAGPPSSTTAVIFSSR